MQEQSVRLSKAEMLWMIAYKRRKGCYDIDEYEELLSELMTCAKHGKMLVVTSLTEDLKNKLMEDGFQVVWGPMELSDLGLVSWDKVEINGRR